MDFYIDESGEFSIPKGVIKHQACVAVCVVVSDLKRDSLERKFEDFCSNLPYEMMVNGEPKGSKLNRHKRIEFCDILGEFVGNLLIIPATIDMSLTAMLDTEHNLNQRLQDRCIELCNYMEHESMKEDLRLKARQFKNLGYQELLKIASYARCLFESIHFSINYLSTNGNEDSWNNVYVEIDRSNKALDSREKLLFSDMLYVWFESWSRKKPFTFDREIHTDQHPLVKNYDTPNGIDGNKMIKEIKWMDSKHSWGLRIADIAANIIYQAVNDLDNKEDNFVQFCALMKLSPYRAIHGPGLFSPFRITKDMDELFKVKYRKLSLEMLRNGL
jgi:uncharacterized protein DUF3800